MKADQQKSLEVPSSKSRESLGASSPYQGPEGPRQSPEGTESPSASPPWGLSFNYSLKGALFKRTLRERGLSFNYSLNCALFKGLLRERDLSFNYSLKSALFKGNLSECSQTGGAPNEGLKGTSF